MIYCSYVEYDAWSDALLSTAKQDLLWGQITENDFNNLCKKFNLLTRAIREKRKVKIRYYSYNKGENERVIDPAEMFLFQDGWYCAAFCEKKHDIRHFELKRILEYELLDEKYE